RVPWLHRPRRQLRRDADPPEQARRDIRLLLPGADRRARGLQAADGLAVPLDLDVRKRLSVRLRPGADRAAGRTDPGGAGADRGAARVARVLVDAGGCRPEGRASGETPPQHTAPR